MAKVKLGSLKGLRVFERTGGRCAWCNVQTIKSDNFYEDTAPNIDHIIPRSKGGGNAEENLQLLCAKCNRRKSDKTMDEFILYVKKQNETEEILNKWSEELPGFKESVPNFVKYLPSDSRHAFIKPIYDYINDIKKEDE